MNTYLEYVKKLIDTQEWQIKELESETIELKQQIKREQNANASANKLIAQLNGIISQLEQAKQSDSDTMNKQHEAITQLTNQLDRLTKENDDLAHRLAQLTTTLRQKGLMPY